MSEPEGYVPLAFREHPVKDIPGQVDPGVMFNWTKDDSVSASLRTDMLTEASSLVTGDRNAQYGEPHQDFQRTANMMSAMGFRAPGGAELEAHHVALLLACVKLSRLVWSPGKRDSWVDLAGYAACGLEAYVLTRPNKEEN